MIDENAFPEQFRKYHLSHWIILLILSAGLWIPTCGLWNLWGPDEARYVQIARELMGRDNWFYLTLFDQPYDQKPPLPFWMFAGMLKLTGGEISSWTLRLPSVLFAVMSVLLTYDIGRHCFGARTGLISALIFLTTPLVLSHAAEARLDMIFTGWIVLSLYPWMTRKDGKPLGATGAVIMWGALAGAFFTKGPLAVIIVASVLITEAWTTHDFRRVFKKACVAFGICGLILLIAGWLLIQAHSVSPEFTVGMVKGETVHRFLNGKHHKPVWFYLSRLFTEIMVPWGVMLIPAGMGLWKSRRSLPEGMVRIVGWILPTFVLLCLAHGKRNVYLLPLMPALALLIGWQIDRWIRNRPALPGWGKAAGGLALTWGFFLLSAAIIFAVRQDIAWRHGIDIEGHHIIVTGCVGLGMVLISRFYMRLRPSHLHIVYLIVSILYSGAVLNCMVVRPVMDRESSTRMFAEHLAFEFPSLKNGASLGALGGARKPEYHIYGDYRVVPIPAVSESFDHPATLPAMVLVLQQDEKLFFDSLDDAGYRKVYRDHALGKQLTMYVRKESALVERGTKSTLCFDHS